MALLKSIGTVETQYYTLEEDLKLETGNILKTPTIAYETYGTLNAQKSNAIYVCHALTGDAHAAGWHDNDKKPGWWNIIIGPGKPLDTNKYFIICSNVIGSCKGSTGPSSINPDTGKEYGLDFPIVTIADMVSAQKKLMDHLEITQLYAVIGGSMGGMQVLEWTISHPEMIRNAIMIASGAYSTPQQIAFNAVERRSITEDPNWNKGNYYHTDKIPEQGLSVARMIGHITYLSNESMYEKFGRRLQDKNDFSYDFSNEFQVESYLEYQGFSFTKKFDANSYLYLTKALDYFDVRKNNSLEEGLKSVRAKMLIMSITSDWLYTHEHMEEIVQALRANNVDVTYSKLNSEYGHDAFLIENGQMNYIISNFLSKATVKDVMSKHVVTLHESKSVKNAAEVMLTKNKTHLPIVNSNNEIIGIITAWDLSKAIAMNTDNIEEIMTKDVATCFEDDSIYEVAHKMEEERISVLPVINEKHQVIGNISTNHLSNLLDLE
ncbi:MAG: homoserine O-acetyltransferase [Methanosphaera sp.]|uniref:homoserine O-acetyltransferase MetX n=1 Tax=Methanosphaera sp. ISO3-F5 TaxID=1452353 RepID=UPI002B261E36|nr:homoserine O-acetyltransferase [Methanosphaera sp. ISO3-F5]MBR0473272.1 homoserine O-acetyltransferase [Methanosphaera sp.]WQH63280.1 homoserine O-acetyltransferase [Methanosphaera sp. ISO3-F5]